MEKVQLLVYFFMILSFGIACALNAGGEGDNLENFAKLGESFDRWLKLRSIPDVLYAKQYPPYNYNSDFRELYSVNISGVLNASGKTTSKCSDDITQVIFNLKSDWAKQMLDSDGKPSGGILQGGLLWVGKYKECVSVYSPIDLKSHGNFHGQFCTSSWTLKLPGTAQKYPLTMGLCVPDSCSEYQVKSLEVKIVEAIGKMPLVGELSSLLNLTSVTCKGKPQALDGAAIAYISVAGILGVCMLFGSLITVFNYFRAQVNDQNTVNSNLSAVSLEHPSIEEERGQEIASEKAQATNICSADDKNLLNNCMEQGVSFNRQPTSNGVTTVLKKILLCFCVFTNGAKILNTDVSNDQMLFVNGIRFLSLTWVIMGHSYISAVTMISNPLDVLHELDNFPFQAVLQAPFSVDSFFLLSGFLLTFLFLKDASAKKGKISWLFFYIHRYWRLTPAYLMSVGFYMVVFKYLGSGPFWDNNHGDACRHTWWWYLLYINNFIPIDDMCIGWSWYLANDMQFYIISPLFLYALWRWPKIGLSIVGVLMAGSWITTGVLSTMYDLIPMFVGVTKATDFTAYENKMWYSFDLIYDKPYCRIGPYLIGVILGYILFKLNDRKNFMSVWQQVLGWVIALSCSLSVVYGLYHENMSTLTGNIYNALCRSSFSIGLAWIIFVCKTGHGGLINKLLSHKFWIPLSRLTYCAYLFHPILIHGYYQALQAPLYFTQLTMVTNFLGFLVMGYGIGFAASLAFESPMMNIEKLLIKKK